MITVLRAMSWPKGRSCWKASPTTIEKSEAAKAEAYGRRPSSHRIMSAFSGVNSATSPSASR